MRYGDPMFAALLVITIVVWAGLLTYVFLPAARKGAAGRPWRLWAALGGVGLAVALSFASYRAGRKLQVRQTAPETLLRRNRRAQPREPGGGRERVREGGLPPTRQRGRAPPARGDPPAKPAEKRVQQRDAGRGGPAARPSSSPPALRRPPEAPRAPATGRRRRASPASRRNPPRTSPARSRSPATRWTPRSTRSSTRWMRRPSSGCGRGAATCAGWISVSTLVQSVRHRRGR